MVGIPIELRGFTKRFGAVTAVEDLSFTAEPGRVTGFLGPNGAGKSTTMKALVGLIRPTAGTATLGGKTYAEIENPANVVGVHLAPAFHPGRTGLDHLRTLAPLVGVDDARCHEALESVGMLEAANRRVGGYSLGMKQRLGLAAALLGRPQVLVLDESANGLDPAGVRWLRDFVRTFAAEGGTVLLSSHMLSEVQQSVDDVVMIARGGRLRHASPLADLAHLASPVVTVRSPEEDKLASFVTERFGDKATIAGPGRARIIDVSSDEVGAAAFADGLPLSELSTEGETLEDVFLRLTSEVDQ